MMAWQVTGRVCGGVVVVRLGSVDGGAGHPRARSDRPDVSVLYFMPGEGCLSKSALVAEWPKVIQENFAIILLETALQKYLLTREMLKMC